MTIKEELNSRFLLQSEYLGINKPVNNIQPLVSITVATYQHASYINDCLNGILMQKTSFPIEVILGEDGSLDGTREIFIEYAKKHPDKIRLFLRDRKLSQYNYDGKTYRFNGIWNRKSAKGKYIAWCEGDDFWIDPLKLQKQIDFLETNQEYGLIHTNYTVIDNANKSKPKYNRNWPSGDVFNLILNSKYNIVSATVLFRTNMYKEYATNFNELEFKMGDLPMWLAFSYNSKIKYIDDITTKYRILNESASHSNNLKTTFNFIYQSLLIRQYFANKFNCKFNLNKALSILYIIMIKESYLKNNFNLAKQYYGKMFLQNILNVFNIKPLLFLLGSKYQILKHFINILYKIKSF